MRPVFWGYPGPPHRWLHRIQLCSGPPHTELAPVQVLAKSVPQLVDPESPVWATSACETWAGRSDATDPWLRVLRSPSWAPARTECHSVYCYQFNTFLVHKDIPYRVSCHISEKLRQGGTLVVSVPWTKKSQLFIYFFYSIFLINWAFLPKRLQVN